MALVFHFKDDDFILAFLQPRTGYVERLMRSHIPILADAAPVHPNGTFIPSAHIEKYITFLVKAERSAMESRAADFTVCLTFRYGLESFPEFFVIDIKIIFAAGRRIGVKG